MTRAEIQEKYKYVIERAMFEMNRAIQNMAFMMDKHFADKDAGYLDGTLHKRLMHEAEEAVMEHAYTVMGVACIMANRDGEDLKVAPKHIKYDKENEVLIYSIAQMEEEDKKWAG